MRLHPNTFDDARIGAAMSDESTPEAPPPSDIELFRAEMRAGFGSVHKRFTAELTLGG